MRSYTTIGSLLRLRRRVAVTLARTYINPPGRNVVSERTGALLDAGPR